MRKAVIVLLLVTLAIMLVMAAPAFAKTGTKSGGY
jgi:Tfp pilus assembly protein FimT